MENQTEFEQEFKDHTNWYKEQQFQQFIYLKQALEQVVHKKIVHKILQNIIKNPKFQIYYGWQKITPDLIQFLSNQTSFLSTKYVQNIDFDFNTCALNDENGIIFGKWFGIFLAALKPVNILHFKIFNNNNFGTTGTQGLTQGLKQLTELKVLNLNIGQIQLEDIGVELISQAITKIRKLQDLSLDLTSNHITELGISYLAQMLKKLVCLQKINLNFHYSKFTSQIIQPLWDGFTLQQNLKELKLQFSSNLLNSDCIHGIERVLRIQTKLRVLDLDLGLNKEICKKGCEYLSEGLKNLTCLEVFRLNLWKSKINEEGMQNLGNALNNLQNLTEISLNISEIGRSQQGLKLFLQGLKNIKKLKIFSYQSNQNSIDHIDIQQLSQFLVAQQNLEKLKLEFGTNLGINSDQIYILMENLIKLPKLVDLNIKLDSNTNFGEEIGQNLKSILPKLINIKILNIGLQYTHLDNEGMKQLCDGISLMTELTNLRLDLGVNEIENSGVQYMVSSLEKLPKIEEISVSLEETYLDNPVDDFIENSRIKNITTLYY